MSDPQTKFDRAYESLMWVEFNNREDKFLHRNIQEKSYTLGGVYQHIHKENTSIDWDFVDNIVKLCKGDYKRASILLYNDKRTYDQIKTFFKKEYWDIISLDEVESNKICQEIFLMGVVSHPRTAARLAQRLLGVADDGFIGKHTLKALNNYSVEMFDKQYDVLEKKYFDIIVKKNENLRINLDGWYNRADFCTLSLFALLPFIENMV